jgi:hypothetical protein
MTPKDQAWILEQQRRLSGVPTLEDQMREWLKPQPQGPTFQDAWASISALNRANDQLRADLQVARHTAWQWQIVAYLLGAIVVVFTVVIWLLAMGYR